MPAENNVFVYYLEIKDMVSKKRISSDDIREALLKISSFEYSKGKDNSLIRDLGGTCFALDVNIRDASESVPMKGSRVRDDNNLPIARLSKTEWQRLTKPDGSDIMEPSYGVFYLPKELTNGCFLFLLRNHHGMAITKIQDYIQKVFPNYRPEKTIMTKESELSRALTALSKLNYVVLDNKKISPARREGIGDYHDRATHSEEISSVYDVKRLQIDVRRMEGRVWDIIKKIVRDFTGKREVTDNEVASFVASSNMYLQAVYVGTKRQQGIDLTKNLYAFNYPVDGQIDEAEFYAFCDSKFNEPAIRKQLFTLVRGITAAIADIDNHK